MTLVRRSIFMVADCITPPFAPVKDWSKLSSISLLRATVGVGLGGLLNARTDTKN